jgi:hypothetical protein
MVFYSSREQYLVTSGFATNIPNQLEDAFFAGDQSA